MLSDFFTMRRGDAQLLLILLMIPCYSSSANSFLAASSLALSSLRYLALTGLPSVTRMCSTLCVDLGKTLGGVEHAWELL